MTALPGWLQPLADAMPTVTGHYFSRFLPPAEGGRDSAVLVLFGDGAEGPDVLLIERASTLALARRATRLPGRRAGPGGRRPGGGGAA